jgi:hypothetical protein
MERTWQGCAPTRAPPRGNALAGGIGEREALDPPSFSHRRGLSDLGAPCGPLTGAGTGAGTGTEPKKKTPPLGGVFLFRL